MAPVLRSYRHKKLSLIFPLFLILLFCGLTSAQTQSRSGDFAGSLLGRLSGELEPSEHPYRVVGPSGVPRDTSLFIPAGTVLLFDEFTGMKIRGRLQVEGTEEEPVIFSSLRDTSYVTSDLIPAPYDWDGITVETQSSRSVFKNSRVLYSLFGIKVLSSSIELKDCEFAFNAQSDFVFGGEEQRTTDAPFSFKRSEPKKDKEDTDKKEKELVLETKTDSSESNPSLPPAASLEKSRGNEIKVFRILCTTAFIGGSVYGALKTGPFLSSHDHFEKVSKPTEENKQKYSTRDFDLAYEKRNENLIHMSVGYGLAVLGLTGFSISFAF